MGIIKIHDRDLRGKTNMGWLNSYHTFSFGGFMDPTRMGFKSLRVFNDDIVAPGSGFGTHSHDNMEIISYVLKGELKHKDSMGTGSIIKAGELQKMSAGSGVSHSEYNASNDNSVHFYQIWIMPDEKGIKPKYEQITLDLEAMKKGFVLVGDYEGGHDKISIHQDAKMYMASPTDGQEISFEFDDGRSGFLQLARGQIELNDELVKEGDGAEISDVKAINIKALADSEIILFDLK